MEVEISVAGPADREEFLEMWGQFLLEHEKIGDDLRASDRTLAYFGALFDAYTGGILGGLPLLARVGQDLVGVLLWGAPPPGPVDRLKEDRMTSWGTFTAPALRGHGVNRALRQRAVLELDAVGIEEVLGCVFVNNPEGCESGRAIGYVPISINAVLDIHTEAEALRQGVRGKKFYPRGLCPLCGRDEPK